MPDRIPLAPISKVFLGIVFAETLVVVVFSFFILQKHVPTSTVAFVLLLIMTTVYLCYFAVDAVLWGNTYQLFAFVIMSVLLTIRVAWDFAIGQANNVTLGVVLVPLIITGLCQVAFLFLSYFVYQTFRWVMFKQVGTSPTLIQKYKWYQFFVSVLHVDVQFVITMTILAWFFVAYSYALAIIIPCACISIVLAALVVELGVRRESNRWTLAFSAFSLFAPVYVIYKTVGIMKDEKLLRDVAGESTTETKNLLITTAILFLICRIILYFALVVVWRNFGKSLKESYFDKHRTKFSRLLDKCCRRHDITDDETTLATA